MTSVSIGARAEDAAAVFLQNLNATIIERNFRCRFGEIDLIIRDHDYLVFAEVRFRKSDAFGSASESVNIHKQRKIILAAQFFLKSRIWAQNVKCRFDVIAITQTIESPQIEWIKDAFNE